MKGRAFLSRGLGTQGYGNLTGWISLSQNPWVRPLMIVAQWDGLKKETNNLSYNENRNYYYTSSSYKDAGRLCFVLSMVLMVLILYPWCSKLITIYLVSTAAMKDIHFNWNATIYYTKILFWLTFHNRTGGVYN